ncbi:hypothetical protein Glove_19g186 [Diversispora epigaea]|uniref:Uncharacterized protein n=1 Tax=Diversispora epigaea TaxID=1348612 RepID=A0A397JQ99_9GLOM|nr:hypothetical protein Glove_19g186 [Diversispora epigaea]
MILEHQDGRKEGCKVRGDKDGSEDGQDFGDTYCKLGMYDSALEYFNRALELANGYAPICKK